MGLVQGLTEFLPVSSSAHIRVVGTLLPYGSDPGAAFSAIIQLGTEAAVLLYFRKDIARIISAWVAALLGRHGKDRASRFGAGDPDAKMGWWVILGSIPIVAIGLPFKSAIESSLRNLLIVAAALAVFGVLLGWVDRVRPATRELGALRAKDAVLLGFAQAGALIPGVSRSGGTITMGRWLGLTREAAARYSFLLAIPAVLGSASLEAVTKFGELTAPGGTGISGHRDSDGHLVRGRLRGHRVVPEDHHHAVLHAVRDLQARLCGRDSRARCHGHHRRQLVVDALGPLPVPPSRRRRNCSNSAAIASPDASGRLASSMRDSSCSTWAAISSSSSASSSAPRCHASASSTRSPRSIAVPTKRSSCFSKRKSRLGVRRMRHIVGDAHPHREHGDAPQFRLVAQHAHDAGRALVVGGFEAVEPARVRVFGRNEGGKRPRVRDVDEKRAARDEGGDLEVFRIVENLAAELAPAHRRLDSPHE